jgi:hypothetical protein
VLLNDNFGASVAINGNTAVVGAPRRGADVGAVYIYQYDPSSSTWAELPLYASDPENADFFGTSVDIDGQTIVVGCYGCDDNGPGSGLVYMYRYNPTNNDWVESKLSPSDAQSGAKFGDSVAIDGDTIAVGSSTYNTIGSNSNVGRAYVFRRNPVTDLWTQTVLDASDISSGDKFGQKVDVSGDTVIVANKYARIGGVSAVGRVYIYKWDASSDTWAERRIIASDGQLGDFFGESVAIDGNTALVGAEEDDDLGTRSGSSYLIGL